MTKKKRSTFAVVMAVFGGAFLLFVIVAGIGLYLFFTSDEGKKVAGVMGEAMKMSKRAQNAPGTKELRARGCKQAMVMSLDDFRGIADALDASVPEKEDPGFGEMVICSTNPWSEPPACDELARTYVGAVGPRNKPFFAMSQKAGRSRPTCNVLYDPAGTRIQDFTDDPTGAPVAPQIPPSDP